MANDVRTTLKDCRSCAHDGYQGNHKCNFQLLPATGPIEFLAVGISGPLLRTTSGNQRLVIKTEIYSKVLVALTLRENHIDIS